MVPYRLMCVGTKAKSTAIFGEFWGSSPALLSRFDVLDIYGEKPHRSMRSLVERWYSLYLHILHVLSCAIDIIKYRAQCKGTSTRN